MSESMAIREAPLPPDRSVRSARDAYLRESGFSAEIYTAAWTPASLLGIRFYVPNTPRHRWAIQLHDLHHVATGFRTDFVGEAQISAWECGGRLRNLGIYTGSIVLSLAVAGLIFAPRRTWAAYRASTGRSLFERDGIPYETLLGLSVAELRRHLGIPAAGFLVSHEPASAPETHASTETP